eukprot:247756_1
MRLSMKAIYLNITTRNSIQYDIATNEVFAILPKYSTGFSPSWHKTCTKHTQIIGSNHQSRLDSVRIHIAKLIRTPYYYSHKSTSIQPSQYVLDPFSRRSRFFLHSVSLFAYVRFWGNACNRSLYTEIFESKGLCLVLSGNIGIFVVTAWYWVYKCKDTNDAAVLNGGV